MKKILLTLTLLITSIGSSMAANDKMTLEDYSKKREKIRILVLTKLYTKVKSSIEEKKGVVVNMSPEEAAINADSCMIGRLEDSDFMSKMKKELKGTDKGQVGYAFKSCIVENIQKRMNK